MTETPPPATPAPQAFSAAWVLAGVFIITAMELLIALAIAPATLTGHLASPMLRMRLEMLMHLASFFVGGLAVGVISPRVRLLEPAVAAFLSVAIVFMTSFFMPGRFLHFSMEKVLIGGGIAFALAMAGAYTGERWMGNIEETQPDSARAAVRKKLWGEQKQLDAAAHARRLEQLQAEKEKLRR